MRRALRVTVVVAWATVAVLAAVVLWPGPGAEQDDRRAQVRRSSAQAGKAACEAINTREEPTMAARLPSDTPADLRAAVVAADELLATAKPGDPAQGLAIIVAANDLADICDRHGVTLPRPTSSLDAPVAPDG